jgi:endonuclease/exonuclease/phosphatase family metal-dependent hydrolase
MIMRLLFILFILLSSVVYPQETFFTAFWNVENLFDIVDDPLIDDAEFLPDGKKNWDSVKFNQKLINLSAVIMSMNRGKGPDLLGLCEVENKAVIESLLVFLNPVYEIVHIESPDGRGIDNALLYRNDKFSLVSYSADTVDLGRTNTRSILYGRLAVKNSDTISVYVNHWPSRSGGEGSEAKRIKAAETLKKNVMYNSDFMIIMGDFNDEPENISVDSVLNAGPAGSGKDLLNLAYEISLRGEGSYKYRENWNMLDQIIISKNQHGIKYLEGSFEIYKPDFIITRSGTYAGTPRPTFGGSRYLGGYSDHFPVTAEFIIESSR